MMGEEHESLWLISIYGDGMKYLTSAISQLSSR